MEPSRQKDNCPNEYSDLYHEIPTEVYDDVYLTDFLVGHELENLGLYRAGGYHPIHFGDILNERYEVLHKLGHGGFGTVWLCQDKSDQGYVAVKVHAANLPRPRLLDVDLAALDLSVPGAEHIAFTRDSFTLNGPNGTHQCLVFNIAGPPVIPGIWLRMENPCPKLKRMCLQVTQAMNFLHSNGICHGDLKPSNILLRLENINHLSTEEILQLLEDPIKHVADVHVKKGHQRPSSMPKYLAYGVDLMSLQEYLTEDICIIDFGEAYRVEAPPPFLGAPENYLPAEILLDAGPAGFSTDIWALGCAIFEIQFQAQLFDTFWSVGTESVLAEIVNIFGKLPSNLWNMWKGRGVYFKEDGASLVQNPGEATPSDSNLETMMAEIIEAFDGGPYGRKYTFKVPEEDQRLCKDLLFKIMKLEPAERLSVADVLNHAWFKNIASEETWEETTANMRSLKVSSTSQE